MRVTRVGSIIGAVCLAGSFVLAVAGTSSASTPGWTASAVPLPATVHNGADAGYDVTITNGGTSNISALYLNSASVPTYVAGPDAAACSGPGVPLQCSFGALVSGAHVEILVAFSTPSSGSSFVAKFQASTTGVAGDPNHNSHGDYLNFSATTALSSNKNFAGGFSTNTDTVSTDDSIGPKNIQSTSVTPPGQDLVTTVEDDLSDSSVPYVCPSGHTCYGTWSQVKVRSLDQFDSQVQTFGTLFPVSLLVRGNAFPNGSQGDIELVHITDDGTTITSLQSDPCGTTPTDGCLDVTKVGNNYLLTTWVFQNGGFKGML